MNFVFCKVANNALQHCDDAFIPPPPPSPRCHLSQLSARQFRVPTRRVAPIPNVYPGPHYTQTTVYPGRSAVVRPRQGRYKIAWLPECLLTMRTRHSHNGTISPGQPSISVTTSLFVLVGHHIRRRRPSSRVVYRRPVRDPRKADGFCEAGTLRV